MALTKFSRPIGLYGPLKSFFRTTSYRFQTSVFSLSSPLQRILAADTPEILFKATRKGTRTVEYACSSPFPRNYTASCLNCWTPAVMALTNSIIKEHINFSARFWPVSAMFRLTICCSYSSQTLVKTIINYTFSVSARTTCSFTDATYMLTATNGILD